MSISTTIKSIQDIMRKDVGVDGDAQRIGQLVWMFFLKIFDDRESEWELLDDAYRSPIPDCLRWRNWAADSEGMTGEELLDFVNTELFPNLKNLIVAPDDPRGFVIRGVFEDAYNYMKSGQLMRQVINKINDGIDFNRTQDRHLFGDVYEQILKDLQSAGNAGEYYTPRAVTQFMVDRVDPQLGDKVLDPACGTGGFHACTIEHIRQCYVKTVDDEQRLQASIHGVEKKPLPHLLCTTNMLLHGIDVPTNVRHDNTLSRPLRDYGPKDRVDVIVTNPPFGGMEEDGIEQNFPANFRTRETADLFLVLIVHLLKDGGRAAVVLPDGTLFGEGIKTRIKEHLLETCNLHTSSGCPTACSIPTRASRPTCCSSPRAVRPGKSGFTNTPTRPATRATPRPSRCASKSSPRSRRGGRIAKSMNMHGGSPSTRSGRGISTSTSRTPTIRAVRITTPISCWPTTPGCKTRLHRHAPP